MIMIAIKPRNLVYPVLCVGVLVLLGACGSSSSHDVTPEPIPVSSVEAFTTYAATQAADETAEPRDVEGLVPPTSETAEPAVVS
jgi:hypothetical protein